MKRIAVDFDDVILPFTPIFIQFCSNKLGKNINIDNLGLEDLGSDLEDLVKEFVESEN